MTTTVVFLLLGLANGAVFGSLAAGLVVTYRSSGVVNFAIGAIGLFTAYSYAYLRRGSFLILIPGLPLSAHFGTTLNTVSAGAIALAEASVLGLLLYICVFRPLRRASAVAKSVASIGITIALVGIMGQRLGTTPISVPAIFSNQLWKLGSIHVPTDRIWFALTVLAIGVLFTLMIRFTAFGLSTRAVAETEVGAYVSGLSPDRVAAANWMLSCAVAGLAGILIAPIVPLVPVAYSLFVIPALAAAAIGRFHNIMRAIIAGLFIGMLQSELANLESKHSWLPQAGLPDLVPLVLILGVLVFRSKLLPVRGELIATTIGRAPRARRPGITALAGLALGSLTLALLHPEWRVAFVTSLIFGIISLSFVIVTGLAGQVSLAQFTLAGVGGFLLSPLTTSWHVPFPLAPIAAALAAALGGLLIGFPALRVRGLPVAVVTLALAVVLEDGWFQNDQFVGVGGVARIAGPTFFGLDLRNQVGSHFGRLEFGFLVLVLLVLVALGVAFLRSSRLGSAMLAVRADERSAAAVGINVVVVKLVAFGIGAFVAGLGGAMLGYLQGSVTDASYSVTLGFSAFALAYVAGITSISGGILAGVMASGGLLYMAVNRWISFGSWYATIAGIGLVLTIVKEPEGIVGRFHRVLAERTPNRELAVESDVAGIEFTSSKGSLIRPERPGLDRPPVRGEETTVPALSVESIRVTYGGVVAVDDVTFQVSRGAIVGLIGPNGAGKTTLLDAICGFNDSTGLVSVTSRRIDGLAPHKRIQSGLGRTFQAQSLYDDLTVRENVEIGSASRWAKEPASRSREAVEAALLQMELSEYAQRRVGELSQGRRQLVSIARALAGTPDVLLLDEPAAGLDTTESRWLGDRLQAVRDLGLSMLVVDHDMSLILGLCDEVCVLDFGELIACGTAEHVQNDPKVVNAYLGAGHAKAHKAPA